MARGNHPEDGGGALFAGRLAGQAGARRAEADSGVYVGLPAPVVPAPQAVATGLDRQCRVLDKQQRPVAGYPWVSFGPVPYMAACRAYAATLGLPECYIQVQCTTEPGNTAIFHVRQRCEYDILNPRQGAE